MGLPMLTTTEKNPEQGTSQFINEIGAFEDFETGQEKAPTVSLKCDPESLEGKLRHIRGRHRIVSVTWAGYWTNVAAWETLSRSMRYGKLWCNVIGVGRSYETIKSNGGDLLYVCDTRHDVWGPLVQRNAAVFSTRRRQARRIRGKAEQGDEV